jgi:ABC-type Mn2+/Zn2+ transport system permease subunit
MGTVVSALGVWLSLQLDMPTGATIVCTFGLVLILMAIARVLIPRKKLLVAAERPQTRTA